MTTRVMVTIKASSMEDAKAKARTLTNFTLDETQDPVSFVDGEWLVFGSTSGGDVKDGNDIVPTEPDHEMTTQDDDDQ